MLPSGPEWIIVLVVVFVIFGGSQLPKLARNLGKAQKEFKDGLAEGQGEPTPGGAASRVDTPAPPPTRSAPSRRPTDRIPILRGVAVRPPSAVLDRFAHRISAVGPRSVGDELMRRRLRMRRRSRSLQPPHTPWSMRCSRAYSRHGSLTGQPAQILRALSTPTPSLGKNVAGG